MMVAIIPFQKGSVVAPMADIYRAPEARRLFDGGSEPASPIRVGAVTAVQVSLAYSVLFMLVSAFGGKLEFSVLIFFLVFTVLSTIVAILFTLSLGLLVNSLLHWAGYPYPLWFCVSVLLVAGLLTMLGTALGAGRAMGVVAIAVCLYGLPIAWIASSRLRQQQRLYEASLPSEQ